MADPSIHPSEITPPEVYFSRRRFLRAGAIAAGAVGTGLLYRKLNGVELAKVTTAGIDGVVAAPAAGDASGFHATDKPTPLESIANYNNFYEFTTDKDGVAGAADGFDTRDWKLEVGGLVGKPKVFDLDDLRRVSAPEERVYRMRCVETWSMVIPWVGWSLSKLLAKVEPQGDAKFVALQTLYDPKRMPGQKTSVLPWPYVEGLRLDEAMHPLAILATGLYGRELPPQDGAPVRLVTPWKYGFKGIKSIVKITLVDKQPPTTWNQAAPGEYGFYANVNPHHDHPRWSQASEQRIGESGRRATLMFNGYADQVASLYAGQDLDVDF
ncbi:MAG TPA: protein-methionine-sulfoxide reductase catalytic subunit MsrP [Kofleriaceae bacterium]|nr:protein-methionine-sulfoxide reductase catalytic subunit MsrP [Kofleriaceae bacterium]